MDCENSIITWVKPLYAFLTEDYLISLANKGIYNRSKKDLEKCKDQLQIVLKTDNTLSIQFEDGTLVSLKTTIQESTCSCVAQNICRHRMTALLYCKMLCESSQKTEDREQKLSNLPELEALTWQEMIKLFGKGMYQSGVRNFKSLKGFTFNEATFMTISLEGMFSVYFTKEHTLEHAICSCKEKGLCLHKLYATFAYLQREGKYKPFIQEKKFKYEEVEQIALQEIQKEISLMLDKGLSSMTEGTIKKIEKLYIKAYSHGFYELANELKVLSSEMIYYFSRNVAFSTPRTMHLFCKTYNRCEALRYQRNNHEKMTVLVGKLRAESMNYQQLNLWGLGARCFLSKRKDLLITSYFYCKEREEILTMTTLRPTKQNTYGKNTGVLDQRVLRSDINYLYSAPLVWEQTYSFEQVMYSEILLKEGVVKEGKLSTTKKSKASIQGDSHEEEIEQFAISHYDQLINKLKEQKTEYFEPFSFNQNIHFIKADTLSTLSFNKITQRLEFIAYDTIGKEIYFYIPYNSVNEEWIKEIENTPNQQYQYLVGAIFWKKDHLEGELLSIVDEKGRGRNG